jgi:hypothetical protein
MALQRLIQVSNSVLHIFTMDDRECPICHERAPGAILETRCSHRFHQACLTTWLQQCYDNHNDATCPYCRHVLFSTSPTSEDVIHVVPNLQGSPRAAGIELYQNPTQANRAAELAASAMVSIRRRSGVLALIGRWRNQNPPSTIVSQEILMARTAPGRLDSARNRVEWRRILRPRRSRRQNLP